MQSQMQNQRETKIEGEREKYRSGRKTEYEKKKTLEDTDGERQRDNMRRGERGG